MTRNEMAAIIEDAVLCQPEAYYYGDMSVEDHIAVGIDGLVNFLEVADKVLSALEVPCHIQNCSTLESP